MLQDCDVIFMDCDGVVFDSNNLKIEAFRQITCNYGQETVSEFITFVTESFGKLNRVDMLQYFVDTYTDCNDPYKKSEVLSSYLAQFADKCYNLYCNVAYTKGFLDFVAKYEDVSKYIVSSSDEDELRTIFKHRQLDKYFDNIFGSTRKKYDIISSILNNKLSAKAVMIGDSYSDLEAAEANNIPFVFVYGYSVVDEQTSSKIHDRSYASVKDLSFM